MQKRHAFFGLSPLEKPQSVLLECLWSPKKSKQTCDVNYFLAWNESNYIIIIIIIIIITLLRNYGHGFGKLLEVVDELLLLLLDCPEHSFFDRGERKWRRKYAVQENLKDKKKNKKMQKSLNKCRGAA